MRYRSQFSNDGEGEFRILPSWQGLLQKLCENGEVRLRWEVKAIAVQPNGSVTVCQGLSPKAIR